MNDYIERLLCNSLEDAGVRCFEGIELMFLGASHYHPGSPGYLKNRLPEPMHVRELVKVALVADKLREVFGNPLGVLSAYRYPAYNAAIGGASNSYHIQGKALDLSPVGSRRVTDLHAAARQCIATGAIVGGVGFYKWGVHIDTGPRRSW